MLLAELEVFHSRPIAPTRRVALGITVLPTAPPPGFGGLLLGGIVAAFVEQVEDDLLPDLVRLTHQLERGQRIPQPRLRHRLQADRVGLTGYRHRLIGQGEKLEFDLDESGAAAPHVLAAVYAAGRLAPEVRPRLFETIRRGLRWRGAIDGDLIEHLGGAHRTRSWSVVGGLDPTGWALGVFGFESSVSGRSQVQRRFRELLREAHPDHGADHEGAAQRIDELTEARRILLSGPPGIVTQAGP